MSIDRALRWSHRHLLALLLPILLVLIALLKVKAAGLPAAALSNSDDLMTADGVPIDFHAVISYIVTDSVKLVRDFGAAHALRVGIGSPEDTRATIAAFEAALAKLGSL